MLGILDDVALGVCSTLEHRYLVEVERPHDLPFPRRQRRLRSAGASSVYRDVEYAGLRIVVELDGWAARPHGCGQGCRVSDLGGSPPPHAGDPPLSA
ncbi:MAG: hypothetical protein Q8Q44_10210, partial [Nocardioides sp.]|nr:hypothetical protein [Nocardioides sp.]